MLKVLFAVGLLIFGWFGVSHAAVTYTLTHQIYGGDSPARGATLDFALTISDAAIQRGSLDFQESVNNSGTNVGKGDYADFIGATWAVGSSDKGALTTTNGEFTTLQTALTFSNGIPSGTIRLGGETSEFAIVGTSGLFGGTLASDFNNCNDTEGRSRCTVLGQLSVTGIPEPASILLGIEAALGFVFLRRVHRSGLSSRRHSDGGRPLSDSNPF